MTRQPRKTKTARGITGTPRRMNIAPQLLSVLFALLIGNRAGSLASGLAGSLALAAAALSSRFLEISVVQSLDLLCYIH